MRTLALASLAALALALPAQASIVFHPQVSSPKYLQFDYTVTPQAERWDFFTVDPNAQLQLATPNQLDVWTLCYGDTQPSPTPFDRSLLTWDVTSAPGHLSILVQGPAGFNNCDQPGTIGDVCARTYNIWGNGSTYLKVQSDMSNPGVTWSASRVGPVPEPATWASLILGFAFIGSLLRTRRAKLI